MPDDSAVSFKISVGADPKELEKLVKEYLDKNMPKEVERKSRGKSRGGRGSKKEKEEDPIKDPDFPYSPYTYKHEVLMAGKGHPFSQSQSSKRKTPETSAKPPLQPVEGVGRGYEDTPISDQGGAVDIYKYRSRQGNIPNRNYGYRHSASRNFGMDGGAPVASTPFSMQMQNIKRDQDEQKKQIAEFKKMRKEMMIYQKEMKGIKGKIEKFDPSQVGQAATIASNPEGFVSGQILSVLSRAGPHGAIAAAIIGMVIASPELAKQMLKFWSQKNLFLNRDWQRAIEDEVNGLFSLEEKRRRLMGLDAYIQTQSSGYQSDTGAPVHNSYENRDEIVATKLGQYDKAIGVVIP